MAPFEAPRPQSYTCGVLGETGPASYAKHTGPDGWWGIVVSCPRSWSCGRWNDASPLRSWREPSQCSLHIGQQNGSSNLETLSLIAHAPDRERRQLSKSEDALAEVRLTVANGDYLVAFDRIGKMRAEGVDSPELRHLAVLCLARGGATHKASELFKDLGLDKLDVRSLPRALTTDIKALWARLLKDQALAATDGQQRRLGEAAQEYEHIFNMGGGYYPAVNAATLWRLAGNKERAKTLAEAILQILAAETGERDYWCAATQAECELLLDNPIAAAATLAEARSLARDDYAALASTRKQLSLLCAAQGINDKVLEAIHAPCVIHFAGHLSGRRLTATNEESVRGAIAAALERFEVGFGFGSLASGADILFAEELLRRGAKLNVFLPFEIDEFKSVSVAPAGGGWNEQFDQCLKDASSIQYSTADSYLGDTVLFTYGSRMAIGYALLRARQLGAPIRQLVVYDGQSSEESAVAGTATDVALWRGLGLETTRIDPTTAETTAFVPRPIFPQPCDALGRRTLKALIFGDVKGFSKMKEKQLPIFASSVLAAFASIIDGVGNRVAYRNTWGDGLYLVISDTPTAARLAVKLQKAMALLPLSELGLPADMGVRLGCHFGPVWCLPDPVIKQVGFMGEHVSRTARIEPVTPEGTIYVTEEFAADLSASTTGGEFGLEYVGRVPAAKNYGYLRMYALVAKE